MDQFGIGVAMNSLVQLYRQQARRTGRTTALVESVKDGDRVVFLQSTEAARVQRLLLDRGVKVECIVIPTTNVVDLFQRGPSQGRTIFDHSWVEQWYAEAMQRGQNDLDHFERELSGYGEAHRETLRHAKEAQRWIR